MITIAYVTARPEPRLEWFFDSLRRCHRAGDVSQIVIVDFFAQACDGWTEEDVRKATIHVHDCARDFSSITQHVPPKPNVWAGKHRLTPRNWWHMATARNTALCYCRNNFIAYLDDRCVLTTTWLDAVIEAMQQNYAVCGTYEKRIGMNVLDGQIVHPGQTTGRDCRMYGESDLYRRRRCPGEWVFGCTFALPTEWMLNVNGVDESWDSVGMEDTHFGRMLENSNYPIFHDGRMKMIEDRTPAEINPAYREHDMKRSSKERHPHDKNDKTHTLIRKLWANQRATHHWNLRRVRDEILNGGEFQIPMQPTHDWFDGEPLSAMT